jgi:cholesterol transport system auxiliary component
MTHPFLAALKRPCLGLLTLLLLGACSALTPSATPPPRFYALDGLPAAGPATERGNVSGGGSGGVNAHASGVKPGARRPTLIVNPPHAASGYDSKHIIYVRTPHSLEYYAHSEWNDTPARMLAPLIVAALENSGRFGAVVRTPSAAAGDLRLDVEIIRLHLDMLDSPSQVRFTLRAYLVDNGTRQVLAWKEFEQRVPVMQEDPYGSVVAANRAVQGVLRSLVDFSDEAATRWSAQYAARMPAAVPVSGDASPPQRP